MEVVIMVAQLLLALTFLVGIHEWGHMFSAKRFGMRVDKFSIGMPPKVYGKKIGETEYIIGALPLGGFVSIAGMVDESMNTEDLKKDPEPWEFRSKPAWQRLIVMLGGIIVNTVAGVFMFIMITYFYGEQYLPTSEVKYGIVAGEVAQGIGLKTGDKILTVNGQKFDDFKEVMNYDILLGENAYYDIERSGETMRIDVPADMLNRLDGGKKMNEFISPRVPFLVGQIQKKSNAEKGGLKENDKIISINKLNTTYFHDFQDALQANKEKTIAIIVTRNDTEVALNIEVTKKGTIGFMPVPQVQKKEKYFSFGESIGIGTKKAFGIFTSSFMALKKVIKRDADVGKTFNSPIAFAQAFGGTWIWQRFWGLTAMISMALAFMNLLPIPALDGGHVMFLLYEMIVGKKPSDKFLEYAQMVGMGILLTLMVYLFGKDIWNLIPGLGK